MNNQRPYIIPLIVSAASSAISFFMLLDYDMTWIYESNTVFDIIFFPPMFLFVSLIGAVVSIYRVAQRKERITVCFSYLVALALSCIAFEAIYIRDGQSQLENQQKIALEKNLNENPVSRYGVRINGEKKSFILLSSYRYGFGIFVLNREGNIGASYYIPTYRGNDSAHVNMGNCKDKDEYNMLMDDTLQSCEKNMHLLITGERRFYHDDSFKAQGVIKDALARIKEGLRK
ncbi:hypothetical protein LLG95_08335 [bacterium]|nr:hypothetical protein [bacterium]